MHHEIDASDWINTDTTPSLQALRGRVVVLTVFQMLCQGCARHSLPQARELHAALPAAEVAVIGMHSVFEHHQVMTPQALRVFAAEYRLAFPIAIDRPQAGSTMPATMSRWALQGTPTLMVFARDGSLALQHFGHLDDLHLGLVVGQLIARRPASATGAADAADAADPGGGFASAAPRGG